MSKKTKFSNPALKKKKDSDIKKNQFNLVTKVNSFNAVFDLQKLDFNEEQQLSGILKDNWIPDNLSEKELEENFIRIKAITSEIRAISRQGAFLVGERVVQAREILKPYRDGTFTLWLETTFGSRRSGYNMLAYYELFRALPDDDLRTKYKSMAQKAAYSLANRKGDIQKKFEIIDQHFSLKNQELMIIVQKEFSNRDRRSKRTITGLINRLLETVDQLVKKEKKLSLEDLEDIKYVKTRLDKILKK